MSDEEDDYMSDKFLTGDVRASLIQQTAKKRQIALEENKQEQIKRQRQDRAARKGFADNTQLQEALKRPIEQQNKGFQMLAKMGYKPGQSLGKATGSDDIEKRLIEPIAISIKADRGGLGREAALRDLAEQRRKFQAQQLRRRLLGDTAEVSTEEFRKRAQLKADERFAVSALRRCQLSCETLDTEAGIDGPELAWFWPERITNSQISDDETVGNINKSEITAEADDNTTEEEFTSAEKLEMLTSYLRTSYKFCFWCGVRYTDQDDLVSNCPGEARDDH